MGARGPQSGHMSRSAASRRRKTASVPGNGRAPACAPSGSPQAPLPGAALGPQCCWVLAQGKETSGSQTSRETGLPPNTQTLQSQQGVLGKSGASGGEAVLPGTQAQDSMLPMQGRLWGVVRYRKKEGPPWALRPQTQATATCRISCTHHHPCLRTGWAPSPGTSASCPCSNGSGGGGGGKQPGWLVHGPGWHCRDEPRGGAGEPA